MFEVLKIGICPGPMRIGWMNVQYHGLILRCNICVYREEKIYIRMPEVFIKNEKFPFAHWKTKKMSDDFQKEMVKILKKSANIDLAKAVELKRQGMEKQKSGDKNKKSI